MRFVIEAEDIERPVNVVTPTPNRQVEFAQAFASVCAPPLRMTIPAPVWALRAVFGGLAEVLVASRKVIPKLLLGAGFSFRDVDLSATISRCLRLGFA